MVHKRAQALFDELVPEVEALPDVALGRMFGTIGLGVRGKIFAFVGTDGDLVAKVGADAASVHVANGTAERKVMRDREMREWISLYPERDELWPGVMRAAYAFVDSVTPRTE